MKSFLPVIASLLTLLLVLPAPAMAQRSDAAAEADALTGFSRDGRGHYQITFPRVRAIHVPPFLLGAFFDRNMNTWNDGQRNFAIGGEFIFRTPGVSEIVIGLEWANLRTTDGFWVESGDPIRRAEWSENNLRLLTLDARYNGLVDLGESDFQFFYGGGVGISVVLGDFYKTRVDIRCLDNPQTRDLSELNRSGDCFDSDGEPRLNPASREREDGVWPILPSLEFGVGLRWYPIEQLSVAIDAGWRTVYLYSGLSVGYNFRL